MRIVGFFTEVLCLSPHCALCLSLCSLWLLQDRDRFGVPGGLGHFLLGKETKDLSPHSEV